MAAWQALSPAKMPAPPEFGGSNGRRRKISRSIRCQRREFVGTAVAGTAAAVIPADGKAGQLAKQEAADKLTLHAND